MDSAVRARERSGYRSGAYLHEVSSAEYRAQWAHKEHATIIAQNKNKCKYKNPPSSEDDGGRALLPYNPFDAGFAGWVRAWIALLGRRQEWIPPHSRRGCRMTSFCKICSHNNMKTWEMQAPRKSGSLGTRLVQRLIVSANSWVLSPAYSAGRPWAWIASGRGFLRGSFGFYDVN